MNLNFEAILVVLTIVTGVIVGLDKWVWSKKRAPDTSEKKAPFLIEQSKYFFPILLLVLLIRSFLLEPFRIPTGSLEPTLDIGDFIVVNKFLYGLRLPMSYLKILPIEEPKRGDIVVFHHPLQSVDYIKRVIGLPGDRISYINKMLYINGRPATQTFLRNTVEENAEGIETPVIEKEENLEGVRHRIFVRNEPDHLLDPSLQNEASWVVPKGQYFMMGDNRDDSYDSRYWGFVPEDHLKGKAVMIWLSWDNQTNRIRWKRMGMRI